MSDVSDLSVHIKGFDETKDAVQSATRNLEQLNKTAANFGKTATDAGKAAGIGLAGVTTALGAVTVAAGLATKAFFSFADAQKSMQALANTTNQTKERVKEIYTEMERLAGKTNFTGEQLTAAFRNFVSRSGMSDANASKVWTCPGFVER